MTDGGQSTNGPDRGICISCSERKPVHVCHGDVWMCSACCSDENAGEGRCERSVTDTDSEVRTDGGLDVQRYRVDRAQSVSYGPAGSASEGWALRFGSEDGERVVVRLDEDAMYHLWTEVHNVPWPSREDDRHDLQREIVARVEEAGPETLREVLDVLGGDRDA
jgi:hypothetical protein